MNGTCNSAGYVIRALEQQPVIALQLAVVRREEDVGVVVDALRAQKREDTADRVVDELVLDLDHRVDFAELVVCHRVWPEVDRAAFGVEIPAVVVVEPVPRLLRECLACDLAGGRMSVGKCAVAEVRCALLDLGHRWIEGMMGIREAHPREERLVRREASEVSDRAIGDPVRMVATARDRVVLDLGCAGLPAPAAGEHCTKPRDLIGMIRPQPLRIVMAADGAMRRKLDMLKPSPWPDRTTRGEAILRKPQQRI